MYFLYSVINAIIEFSYYTKNEFTWLNSSFASGFCMVIVHNRSQSDYFKLHACIGMH